MPNQNKQPDKLKSKLNISTNNGSILPTLLKKLTPEQETLIYIISEEWRNIAFLTERIDHEKARVAIQGVYEIIGKSTPQIIFVDSPYAAMNQKLEVTKKDYVNSQIKYKLENELKFSFINS